MPNGYLLVLRFGGVCAPDRPASEGKPLDSGSRLGWNQDAQSICQLAQAMLWEVIGDYALSRMYAPQFAAEVLLALSGKEWTLTARQVWEWHTEHWGLTASRIAQAFNRKGDCCG